MVIAKGLTHSTADLDINAAGFNWDVATRHGSRGLVVWKSNNLVDWSEPRLQT